MEILEVMEMVKELLDYAGSNIMLKTLLRITVGINLLSFLMKQLGYDLKTVFRSVVRKICEMTSSPYDKTRINSRRVNGLILGYMILSNLIIVVYFVAYLFMGYSANSFYYAIAGFLGVCAFFTQREIERTWYSLRIRK